MKTVSTKTMLKCSFSNEINKLIQTELGIYGVKKNEIWKHYKKLTPDGKSKLIDKILDLHYKTSNSLSLVAYEKRNKKRIEAKRKENGYYEKKKKKAETV